MERYLTDLQMASLVEAIQDAERHTSGEIRIHIDNTTAEKTSDKTQNAKVAFEVFKSLGMDKTQERNAVLFHVNFSQKYLTIIGDEGIHQKVTQNFWDELHDRTIAQFSTGNYFEGLKNAVAETGTELKIYFPLSGHHTNELSDEITFS